MADENEPKIDEVEQANENETTEITDNITEPQPIVNEIPKKKPNKKKRIILSIVIAVILLGGGVAAWWLLTHQTAKDTSKTSPTTSNNSSTPVETDEALAKYIKPTTGETWTGNLKQIADPGFVADPTENTDTMYYEVGKHGDNTIVLSTTPEIGVVIDLFERTPDGKALYIARPNAFADYSQEVKDTTNGWPNDHWSNKVTINNTISYDSLSIPKTLALSDDESVSAPSYFTLGDLISQSKADSTVTVSTVKTLGSNKLVKIERKYVDTGLTAINYAIDSAIGTRINLTYQPISTTTDKYTWNNSLTTKSTMGGVVRGCGALGSSVARSDMLSDSDFIAAGKTDSGKTLYAFKDSTANILKVLYDEYTNFNEGAATLVSFDTFLAGHAVIAYKSPLNGWLIYSLDDYAAVGGCGKPVVYLYPTKTQNVTVKVGADVKVSEPLYNASTGWKDVVAQPNGQLTYNGNSYSSLFWEGTGFGAYPAITGGTVVASAKAAATIRSQLAAQGFNAKEIADFMSYWEPLIPKTAYIRLTWFNTVQLDTLAPLYINPRPDTVIRTFLDMKGLDQPITIPGQTFSAQERKGFTVVEWGGLLHKRI